MKTTRVLISGASIAGPAVGLWLSRLGYEVTIVEQASGLRPGGQAVDFKGATHRTVLERMGIWDAVVEAQTPKTDLRIIDDRARVRAVMPGEFLGGDVEILRGDLVRILHERTAGDCRYVFGDRITRLTDSGSCVEVEFARAAGQTFDLVIGADGVHSGVRRLAFGPESDSMKPLGYYYAVADAPVPTDLPTVLPSGRQVGYAYNEPGRLGVLGGSKAPQLFVFSSRALRSPQSSGSSPLSSDLGYDRRDVDSQKRFLARHYEGAGWRLPELVDAAMRSDDFFLDSFSRTRMTRFTSGRIALVGDAGYANTLGGFGTGLALLGAYVLGGELARSGGDHAKAFAAYDTQMFAPTKVARSGNAGPFLAPPSRLRMRLRDATFSNRLLFGIMMKMTDSFATTEALPAYAV